MTAVVSSSSFIFARWTTVLLVVGFVMTASIDSARCATPATVSPAQSPRTPSPALVPSPVNEFRRLLAMEDESREDYLARVRPAQSEVLRRKVKEYNAMPVQERELRFRQLELCRWLLPLMRLSPDQRESTLPQIPPRERVVVEERLSEWNRLSTNQQANVMNDKTALSYFFRPEPAFIKRQMDLMIIMPPNLRTKMETELLEWKGKSLAEKEKMQLRLNQLMRLKQADREKIVTTLIPAESDQLRSTFSLFLQLTPEQRQRCVEGFNKLANLSATERQRFIFDSKRWQHMSAEQKDLWRAMILRLRTPPPAPPNPLDTANSAAALSPSSLATNQ